MDEAGVDPSTWHNGSRVLPGGGGKWIAPKFKELPASVRGAVPLALPPTYAPPPLPLEEMLRLAKEKQNGAASDGLAQLS